MKKSVIFFNAFEKYLNNRILHSFKLMTKTMKTRITNQNLYLSKGIFVLAVIVMSLSKGAFAQEQDSTQTLFKSVVKVSELWTPEVKLNSIQDKIGTLIGFYGGAVFNRTFLLGISGGANLSHPTVNYGYFGAIGQYIYKPTNLWHFSGQLLLAYGSAKDYEDPKSGLLDNFCNVSGAGFFLMEPGVNVELNLSRRITLVAGMSYRYITGMDENSENLSITHVTNEDMSGINFNIGLKFSKEKKSKKD
jgi:hypothetical protein